MNDVDIWAHSVKIMNRFPNILKPRISAWLLALVVAIYITAANNDLLFLSLRGRMDHLSMPGGAYLVTMFVFLSGAQCIVFLALGTRYLLKPILVTFILLSAILSYFTQDLGVLFDQEMIRNVVETFRDHNLQQALELVSFAFVKHLFIFGVLPSVFVSLLTVEHKDFRLEFGSRMACALSVVAVLAVLALPNWKYLAYFSVENRDLRMYMTPIYAFGSAAKYARQMLQNRAAPFRETDIDAYQEKHGDRKIVGIVVVGETARADHFSLNGYGKRTNPLLEQDGVVSFNNVSSCGTSTAFSVPCMFSLRDRRDFSPEEAANESNVLDILSRAGVHVVWLDDNSSCSRVCARIESENLRAPPAQENGQIYDESLLRNLDQYVQKTTSDLLIVLHTIGSHGPAYHERIPDSFAVFKPFCGTNSPQECSDQDVVNAYDNTIVYTDYVLDEAIEFLHRNADQFDSFLLYASDHGESLGENGVYLHGLPYFLAPKSQLNIPMIFWMSEDFSSNRGISLAELASKSDFAFSHDNFSHSLLGLFNIKSTTYRGELDIFRPGA